MLPIPQDPVHTLTARTDYRNRSTLQSAATGPLPIDHVPRHALAAIDPGGNCRMFRARHVQRFASAATTWREELIRLDHNFSDQSSRYVPLHSRFVEHGQRRTPLDGQAAFPTIQTTFEGPAVSLVARLTGTISPTLLNEFVASYTTDHISLTIAGLTWQAAARAFPWDTSSEWRWRKSAGHQSRRG